MSALEESTRSIPTSSTPTSRPEPGKVWPWVPLVILTAAAAIWFSLWREEWHDYRLHYIEWRVILDGGEPWRSGTMNAYGPLFNVLALLAAIHPLAPKLLFCLMWFAVSAFLIRVSIARRGAPRRTFAVALLTMWNPFFWTNVASHGQFDILVAGLCLAGVHWSVTRDSHRAGAAIGLAVLLKYYPLLLVPFLAIDRARLRLKTPVVAGLTTVAGLAASWTVWAESTFNPILFAAERESKMLSVFAFLRGRWSPLHTFWTDPNVDFLAAPLLIISLVLVVGICYRRQVAMPFAVLAGAVCGLTVYKVGHQQFLLVIFVLVAYLVALGALDKSQRLLRYALATYLGWLVLFDLAYAVSGRNNWGYGLWDWPGILLREFAGLPTFILGSWVVLEVLVYPWPAVSARNAAPLAAVSHGR